MLFFFVAYLTELAADPNKKKWNINSWYKQCFNSSNKCLAAFFKLQ